MLSSHESMLSYPARPAAMVDRRCKPDVELAPNCPRCDSSNTKFCYYNNYSLSQPRYFCKGCRRYWTKGGSLRNVPVGGGCRKNRRGKAARPPGDSAATRDLACTHRLSGPVRPDLLLDGMVGNTSACQGTDLPGPADGSSIDLAMLYARFLNQRPEIDNRGGVTSGLNGGADETFESFSGSSDMSPGLHAPVLFDPSQDGFREWSGPGEPIAESMLYDLSQQSLGELEFSVDQSGYESLGLPTDGGNCFFSSNCSTLPNLTWEETKYQSFESLPEDSIKLHEAINPGDWSALDCLGLEALYRH